MKRMALCTASALALFALPQAVEASGDYGCFYQWTLTSPSYQCANRAVLSPGNDTRVNLALLLRDRAGLATPGNGKYAPGDYRSYDFGHVFFNWGQLQASYYPSTQEAESREYEGGRCASLGGGNEGFTSALMSTKRIRKFDRTALTEARGMLSATCDSSGGERVWPTGIGSKLGRDFLAYLTGADAFYAGRFDEARSTFSTLSKSRDSWVSETAAYMVARNELVAAQAPAFNEWGDYEGAEKTDKQAARLGQSALGSYLKAYPQGRYAASARGLQRRALWLAGDREGLGRAYADLLVGLSQDTQGVPALIEEIDNKLLLATGMAGTLDTPLLLATSDLQRMRVDSDLYAGAMKPISAEEIAAQKPVFASAPDLFTFVKANHAFYAESDYRRVLDLLPDNARLGSYTPLAFSRQMLRGSALEALNDRNAAGFWLELIEGAQDLYQRPAVELALAMNWERHGRLAQVFAKDSPISESEIRILLLLHGAGDALLRAQAKRGDRPARERGVALFTLLHKQLSRGRYGAFLGDLPLVPEDASTDGYIGGWLDADAADVPVGLFTSGTWSDNFDCPSLARTAATLARKPSDPRAQLCLGEFYRLNGFDYATGVEARPSADELAGGPNEFGGTVVTRAALYDWVINDPRTTGTDKAYALYRAVWCYGPSGNNSCGGEDVPVARRKAWFQQLKRDYPASRWARNLKYYW